MSSLKFWKEQWDSITNTDKLFNNSSDTQVISKYKVLLFGGIDYANEGSYGSNKKLGEYIEILSQSDKYKIPLQKGDIQVLNSPLFSNEWNGKDIYEEILKITKNNYDYQNGTLILY
ncbi:MAG: hypothetical protein LC109_12795, partial [Bacteroidia bacterium]|nr:hypothetical protein [Bacteroidia bacterium]